jgi:hypothetical protein
MLRPPSLYKTWDEYVSIDGAFIQAPTPPEEGASDEARAEYEKAAEEYLAKLKSSRETGSWEQMLAPGRTLNEATKFTLLQVDRNTWRDLLDRHTLPLDVPNRIGPGLMRAVMVRLALKSITGLDVKVERSIDDKWGYEMAQPDIVSYLDAINPRVVGELGTRIMERMRGADPL